MAPKKKVNLATIPLTRSQNDPGLEIGLSGKHSRLIPFAHASTLTAVPGFSCCLLITKNHPATVTLIF